MSDFPELVPWFLQDVPLAVLVHLVLVLATVPRILQIKHDATDALVWLMAVVLLPYLGAGLFWMFGDPAVRKPLRRIVQGGALHIVERPRLQGEDPESRSYQLQRILAELHETAATEGNETIFYTDGRDFFRDLEADLRAAQHEICMQFYIYREDRYGLQFGEIMMEKARAGVRVHFLYDAIGSAKMLSAAFLARLKAAGVQVHPFLPFKLFRRRVQINFRNHRKVAVIDRKVAYTGGMNVGEEYAGEAEWAPHWFDMHARIAGPAVPQVLETFAADWVFASGSGRIDTFLEPTWREEKPAPHHKSLRQDSGIVQTVSSGPDQEINRIRTMIFFAATRARRRLWIASPYFVPDESLGLALVAAAYGGIDVRLLTQNENPDAKLAHMAARYYFDPLIRAGVRVYQYHPGMMHSKMMLVDDEIATVGSANFDVRSMRLNFELNLLFYSPHEIRGVEQVFNESFPRGVLLDQSYLHRPWPLKIAENFCRLFAPVL